MADEAKAWLEKRLRQVDPAFRIKADEIKHDLDVTLEVLTDLAAGAGIEGLSDDDVRERYFKPLVHALKKYARRLNPALSAARQH